MNHHKTTLVALLLALTAILVGCEVGITGQDIEIRHDSRSDSLELFIVTYGIHASGDLEKARQQIQPAVDQDRVIWIPPWGAHFNLDKLSGEELDPLAQRVVHSFELLESTLFEDEEGQLCGLQRFTIHEIGLAVELINRELSKQVLEEFAEEEESDGEGEVGTQGSPEDQAEDPDFDRESKALCISAAQRGHRWIELCDGRLILRVPVTSATATRIRDQLIEDIMENSQSLAWLGQHLLYLQDLEIGDHETRLEFAAPTHGVVRFESRDRDREYGGNLHDVLRREGVVIQEALDPDALRLPRGESQ